MSKIGLVFFILCLISCSKLDTSDIDLTTLSYSDSLQAKKTTTPFLFTNEKEVFLSWTKKLNDTTASLQYLKLQGNEWSTPIEIEKGSDWFLNWADFPVFAENNGYLLSHFLQKSDIGAYTYDIKLKLYNKLTESWSKAFLLHQDGTKSEHGFVTILPSENNSFFVTWLDGRNTVNTNDHHAMTVRAARVLVNGEVTDDKALDLKTCDCCQTTAALTQNGPVVVYRDRTDDEIRDISITRYVNGNWTSPKPVFNDNWKINGCPVNGPSAAAREDHLAVAWYTAADEIPKVKLIFSTNNGVNFDTPMLIDEVKTVGRVGLDFIDKENVMVTWVSSEESQTYIKAMRVAINGAKSEIIHVSKFDPSRSSGFPQLAIVGDRAYFAWTDVFGENPEVKTAYIELDNL